MLPVAQRIAFLAFAVIAIVFGAAGMWGVVARILRGRADADLRGDQARWAAFCTRSRPP